MPTPLSGPGIGLPAPQNLYPSELFTQPYDSPTNQICLSPGEELPIPAGNWNVSLGFYLILEFLDPVTNIWTMGASAGWESGNVFVKSDGFNVRVANRTGCPVGAVILVGGTNYVQGSTSIVVTGAPAGVGGTALSTWLPIVGGTLSISTTTIVTANAGAGYGIAPIALIPPPAPANVNANGVGGIQASGFFTVASGTISGFTFTNSGAGYSGTTFNVVGLPNPTDPNINTGITLGTVTFTVGGTGVLTGVLCTNPGAPYQAGSINNISLTVSGAGASASINPVMLQCVTTASLIGGSTINGAAGSVAYAVTEGGFYPQGSITASPENLLIKAKVRPAAIALTVGGAGTLAAQVGTIYDGGFFFSTPNPVVVTNGLTAATGTIIGSSTLSLTMGPKNDICILQPAP